MPRRLHLGESGRSSVVEITGHTVRFVDSGDQIIVGRESAERFTVQHGADTTLATAVVYGDTVWVFTGGSTFEFHVGTSGGAQGDADTGALSPPMPATVVRVAVRPGQTVASGDLLVALEAMKMELPIRATRAGVVRAVHCREGELVQPGTRLLEIES